MQLLPRLIILLLGWGAGLFPLHAAVFPVQIGSLGQESGTLDVAKDKDFQEILVSIRLGGRAEYLINFPETGVYYIRVRQQQGVVWQEAMLALLNHSREDQIARLQWTPVPEALRYRLWLSRDSSRPRWFESTELAVLLHKIGTPWLIRLRGITAQGELLPVPDISLRWVPALLHAPEAAPPKAPDMVLDLNAPDDDQVVYEPEDKDLLSGPEEGPMTAFISRTSPVDLPPLVRKHEVFVWLRYLREQFSIDKKDRFEAEPSSGLGTGAGGQYFLAPNLAVSGAIDTHATRTDYEAGGAQAPNTEQKRIRFHLALGLDILNTHFRTTDWSLMLGPAAGLVQMPLQQNDQKFTDYGLHFASQYYPYRIAFTVLLLKSGSRELHARWIAPWTIWSMQPFLGSYLYNTRHSAGAVTGRFHESGLRFGLERDF
jgi:hypothetical protein